MYSPIGYYEKYYTDLINMTSEWYKENTLEYLLEM